MYGTYDIIECLDLSIKFFCKYTHCHLLHLFILLLLYSRCRFPTCLGFSCCVQLKVKQDEEQGCVVQTHRRRLDGGETFGGTYSEHRHKTPDKKVRRINRVATSTCTCCTQIRVYHIICIIKPGVFKPNAFVILYFVASDSYPGHRGFGPARVRKPVHLPKTEAERNVHNDFSGNNQWSNTDAAPNPKYGADGFEAQRRATKWLLENRLPAVGGGKKGADQSFNKT